MKGNFLLLLIIILTTSCKEEKPYAEFERNLQKEICNCIELRNVNQDDFLEKYSECMVKTSTILKNSLNDYPEDPRMSKEKYLRDLPKLIQDIVRLNKC